MRVIAKLSGSDRPLTVTARTGSSGANKYVTRSPSTAHADPYRLPARPDRSNPHGSCMRGLHPWHHRCHSALSSSLSQRHRKLLSVSNDRRTTNVLAVYRDYEVVPQAASTGLSCHPPIGGDVTIPSIAARNATTPADTATARHPSRRPASLRLSSLQPQAADRRLDQCPASTRPWVLRGGVQSNDISHSLLSSTHLPRPRQWCGAQACVGAVPSRQPRRQRTPEYQSASKG